MNNPLTDYRKRLAGEETQVDSIRLDSVLETQRAYDSAYDHCFRILIEAKRNKTYSSPTRATSITGKLSTIFSTLKNKVTTTLEKGVWNISKLVTGTAQNDLLLLGLSGADKITPPDKTLISTILGDSFDHVAAQTDRMTATVKQQLRSDIALISRRAAIEGISRAEAYKALREEILSRPSEPFSFIDRTGRKWSTETYLKMLVDTVLSNAEREAYIEAQIQSGNDLIQVSQIGTVCKLCSPWKGKVLSISGATPDYPTLATARASGLFHPNCKHSLVVFQAENFGDK